jgi:hypothetical protein
LEISGYSLVTRKSILSEIEEAATAGIDNFIGPGVDAIEAATLATLCLELAEDGRLCQALDHARRAQKLGAPAFGTLISAVEKLIRLEDQKRLS